MSQAITSTKATVTTATVAAAIVILITMLIKFTDAFDSMVAKSTPVIELRAKAIQQDGKIDRLSDKVDDVKQDTKDILKTLRRR